MNHKPVTIMAYKYFIFLYWVYTFEDFGLAISDVYCSCAGIGPGCNFTNRCKAHSNCAIENVALGMKTEMSSQLASNRFGYAAPPCVAVNGNTGNKFVTQTSSKPNCAHTNINDYQGWWQVHLQREHSIMGITVYGQDYGQRLQSVRITVDGLVCYEFQKRVRTEHDGKVEVKCLSHLRGRTVRFEKTEIFNDYYLVLCEVQVWACARGRYGDSCNKKCSSHCKDDICNDFDGRCPHGCTDGFFGSKCDKSCGHCLRTSCDVASGECLHGCESGWLENGCQRPCFPGTYGINCKFKCGFCGDDRGGSLKTCNAVTGVCDTSCQEGYEGLNCDQAVSANSSTSTIIGVVSFLLVGVVTFVVGFLIFRRRRLAVKESEMHTSSEGGVKRNKLNTTLTSTTDTQSTSKIGKMKVRVKPVLDKTSGRKLGHFYENARLTTPVVLSRDQTKAVSPNVPPEESRTDPEDYDDKLLPEEVSRLYGSDAAIYGNLKTSGKHLDSVQHFLVDRLASGELLVEFKEIPKGLQSPHEIAMTPINKHKNRFTSVVPYDHNRVILNDGYTKGESTDYVNASFIRGCHSEKQYIAAQGPRDKTVADFWRMVWQEHVTQIIMLTSLIENGKSKCCEYWPAKDTTQTYGPLTVTGLDVQCRAFYIIRTFRLTLPKKPGDLYVSQYHFIGWPDHGVPSVASLVDFWRYIRGRTVCGTSSPLLVHCSAGVGRTGTFIGLDIAIERIERNNKLNILDIVLQMRSDKTLMVQAPEQYVFLHKSILEAYTGRDTMVSLDHFDRIFPRPITAFDVNQRIDKEFQTLKLMQSLVTKQCHDVALQQDNKRKNRNQDVLPADEHLLYLTITASDNSQYINAVNMPTFREQLGCILTQLPLSHTLIDFWRLVEDYDVTTVVSLGSKDDPVTIKDFCQYWPMSKAKSLLVEPYVVTLKTSSKLGEHLTSYTVKLEKKGTRKPRDVCVLHYTAWTEYVPSSTPELLLLVDTLDMSNSMRRNKPVIIQCLDGGTKSALFCAIRDVISRITYDREVDVYMTVRKVQNIRPGAVTSEAQYRYCYQVAQQKIKEQCVYE